MAALVTTEFRIHNAKQFREMFSEAALIGGTGISDAEETALSTNLYLFIGKSSAWSGNYTPPGEAQVTFLIQVNQIPIIRMHLLQIQLQILLIHIGRI